MKILSIAKVAAADAMTSTSLGTYFSLNNTPTSVFSPSFSASRLFLNGLYFRVCASDRVAAADFIITNQLKSHRLCCGYTFFRG